MTQMTWKAKTSRVNRAAAPTPSSAAAAAYCRAVDNWPRSWMGLPEDVPPGEQLLACFRPFLEQLASSSLSPKTIRKHVDNLWLLGGELIRELHEDPARRKAPASRLLNDRISPDGGPLIHNGSEEDQLAFDSTCRKLCRFLTNPQR